MLRGEDPRGRYFNHGVPPQEGVTDERYKLIHYKFDEVDEWEFFDRERDPGEMKSEYGNPEYAQAIDRLKTELARLRSHYGVE